MRRRNPEPEMNKRDHVYHFLGVSISNLCREGRKMKYLDDTDQVFEDIFGAEKLASQLSMTHNLRGLRNIMRGLPVEDLFDCMDNPAAFLILKGMIQSAHAIRQAEVSLSEVSDSDIQTKDYADLRKTYKKLKQQYKNGVERFKNTYDIENSNISASKAFKAFAKGEFYGYNGKGNFAFFDEPYDYYDDDYDYDNNDRSGSRFEEFCNNFEEQRPRKEKMPSPVRYRQPDPLDGQYDEDISDIKETIRNLEKSIYDISNKMSFNKPTVGQTQHCESGHSFEKQQQQIKKIAEIENGLGNAMTELANKQNEIIDTQNLLIDRYEKLANIIEEQFSDDSESDPDDPTDMEINKVINANDAAPVTPEELEITDIINQKMFQNNRQNSQSYSSNINTTDVEPIPSNTIFDEDDGENNAGPVKTQYNK